MADSDRIVVTVVDSRTKQRCAHSHSHSFHIYSINSHVISMFSFCITKGKSCTRCIYWVANGWREWEKNRKNGNDWYYISFRPTHTAAMDASKSRNVCSSVGLSHFCAFSNISPEQTYNFLNFFPRYTFLVEESYEYTENRSYSLETRYLRILIRIEMSDETIIIQITVHDEFGQRTSHQFTANII